VQGLLPGIPLSSLHLFRNLPVFLFLFLIRKLTRVSASGSPSLSRVFLAALYLLFLNEIIRLFLGLSQSIALFISETIFWILIFTSFGISFFWVMRTLKFNEYLGNFLLSFFLPFTSFLTFSGLNYFQWITGRELVYVFTLFGLLAQLFWIYTHQVNLLVSEMPEERTVNYAFDNEGVAAVIPINSEFSNKALALLTSREKEVLLAYCNGFTYQEIGNSFFISPNTVKTHLRNIYRKLEINSKTEAIYLLNNFREE
jgi:DNA-binding CsgD family transcriptional regulator